MKESCFDTLPRSIWENCVFPHLVPEKIADAGKVNRGFYAVSRSQTLWRKKIADWAPGQESLLHWAIACDQSLETIQSLVNKGYKVDEVFIHDKFTALHVAAQKGRHDVVALLLDCGANIDAVSLSMRRTALHKAVYCGNIDVVKLLLDRGAQVDLADCHGATALHKAVYCGNVDAVKLLLDHGAQVNAIHQSPPVVRSPGKTFPIMAASPIHEGDTALHIAAGYGNVDVVKLLLDCGANINAENKNGESVLDAAKNNGCTRVVDVLTQNSQLRIKRPLCLMM